MILKNIFTKDVMKQLNGVAILVFYFIGSLAQAVIFSPFENFKYPFIVDLLSLIYSGCLIVALGWFARDLFIKSFKQLKNEHSLLFKKYLPFWFIALIGMIFFNFIANYLNGGNIAANENAIRSMFGENPFYVYFSAVIIAPIIEELVFRAGFFHIFKNKYVFILFSGITFGAMHVLPGLTNLSELAFLIPYSIPGIVFAYTLYDSKNIFVPIGLHFIHNGTLMSIQVFLMLIGA